MCSLSGVAFVAIVIKAEAVIATVAVTVFLQATCGSLLKAFITSSRRIFVQFRRVGHVSFVVVVHVIHWVHFFEVAQVRVLELVSHLLALPYGFRSLLGAQAHWLPSDHPLLHRLPLLGDDLLLCLLRDVHQDQGLRDECSLDLGVEGRVSREGRRVVHLEQIRFELARI